MANHLADLTGKKFGRLTVIERDFTQNEKGRHGTFWLCKCDCGNTSVVLACHLKNGHVKSCGCSQQYDLCGKKFGRWTVLHRGNPLGKGHKTTWVCRCDCGTVKTVLQYTLLSGASKSCGCYHKDELTARLTTHGLSKSRLYTIYRNILSRCFNENDKRYFEYGGRGITVCDSWHHSFEEFSNWAFSHGYNENLTIDRIDNDLGYTPENCRWATTEQQSNNKQKTIYFEFLGVKKSLHQWTNYMNWSYSKYFARHYRGKETFHCDEIEQIEQKLRKEQDNVLQD